MQILTNTGYIQIENATPGMSVPYYDLQTGERLENEILAIEQITKEWYESVMLDQRDIPPTERIDQGFDFRIINGTYKFFREQLVWTNLTTKYAKDLQIGDVIYDDNDQDVTITSISMVAGTGSDIFWKLSISGDHSFIVDGITLHNSTLYAKSAGGNWSAAGTWSSTSSAGSDNSGPPTASIDVIFDSGSTGNVTVDTTSCVAKTLVCQAAANSITFTSGKALAISGNITFYAGMTVSGTGNLVINAAGTVTTNGVSVSITTFTIYGAVSVTLDTSGTTWTNITSTNGSQTITLASNLSCSGTLLDANFGNITFAGSGNITCGTFTRNTYLTMYMVSFVSGTTLTINSSFNLSYMQIKSTTATSPFYLVYNGTAANCALAGNIFTDVDASGSPFPITNWCGGTLTRCTNIVNSDMSKYPAASNVYSGTDRGDGVTGTLHASNISAAAGSGSNLSAGILKNGETVDDITGTYAGGSGGGGISRGRQLLG
jgi:hypothetical protein